MDSKSTCNRGGVEPYCRTELEGRKEGDGERGMEREIDKEIKS